MSISVIAEVGVNHNGDLGMATELIDVAADSGCPYVKFQTFKTEQLVTESVTTAAYQSANTGAHTQKELLQSLELSIADHDQLLSHAQSRGITFISTAFDTSSLALLQKLGVPFLKIPSGELRTAPLLVEIGRANLPVIMSTGMASVGEIETALGLVAFGKYAREIPENLEQTQTFWIEDCQSRIEDLTLLHCTSQYPAPADQVNLSCIASMRDIFGLPVGYSDHTMGLVAPILAASYGASVIEKHITLDRALPGPDHKASLEPDELVSMVSALKDASVMMGDGHKRPVKSEIPNRALVRHRLIAIRDIEAGEAFSTENVGTARSSQGLDAVQYYDIMGQIATRPILRGNPVA